MPVQCCTCVRPVMHSIKRYGSPLLCVLLLLLLLAAAACCCCCFRFLISPMRTLMCVVGARPMRTGTIGGTQRSR
jgi:hypothetical protein